MKLNFTKVVKFCKKMERKEQRCGEVGENKFRKETSLSMPLYSGMGLEHKAFQFSCDYCCHRLLKVVDCRNMGGPSHMSVLKMAVSTMKNIADSWRYAENGEKLYISKVIIPESQLRNTAHTSSQLLDLSSSLVYGH